MSYKNEALRLVKRLGEFLNLPTLNLENGPIQVNLEGTSFAFFWSEDKQALFIEAALGDPISFPNPDKSLERLLKSNNLWGETAGGSFGLNGENGELFYVRRLDFPLTDEPFDENLLIHVMPPILGVIEAAVDICRPRL